jgi:hypothetical protein
MIKENVQEIKKHPICFHYVYEYGRTQIGRQPQFFANGRQPTFFRKRKMTSTFWQNGRRPQFLGK